MKLLYKDMQDTDGSDLSRIVNVYQVAGRRVRLPGDIVPEQVKQRLATRYGLSASEGDQLEQVEDALAVLDMSSIQTLDEGSNATQIVSAIKLLAGAVRDLKAAISFQMKDEPSAFDA